MVKLTRIYTRQGDGGDTHLGDMSRVRKTSGRVEAYGEVDEANSAIGVARALGLAPRMDEWLGVVQNDLFDVGADLAVPGGDDGRLRIVAAQVARLERWCDAANAELPPLESFVLPGGTPVAASLHLARAISRRAERAIVALSDAEPVNDQALAYVNRLSDLLFILARRANVDADGDVTWVPGASRAPDDGDVS
jgi:cob(I)alamin adenosyltransferase